MSSFPNRRRVGTRPWIVGGLVLACASISFADDAKKERIDAARNAVEEVGRDVGDVAREAELGFASKLIGKNLSGSDERTVGEIEDLMIDPEQGRVAFAVILHEDHRRSFLAVPLRDLTIRKTTDGKKIESVRIVGEKDSLRDAPSFTEDRWNEAQGADFRRRVDARAQKERTGTETPAAREGGAAAGAGKLARASEMMSHRVENAQGERIGGIEDFLLNTSTGKIEYVVVGMGGFLGIGEKRHAVPCSMLKPTGHDACRLDLSREKLVGAPTFELKGEEDAPARDPRWIASVHEYYGVTTPSSGKMLRGSKLIGWTVKTPAGEDLGKVNDVAINIEEGQASYVVLKRKGTLGFGGALIAMPWSALCFQPDEKCVSVTVDKQRLDASKGFPARNWPREADPTLFETSEAGERSAGSTDRGYSVAQSRPHQLRDLLDYDLENSREKDLGEINDVVFDEANGRVSYVAISVGGFLGIGDKLFAIPWQSLKVKPGREVFVLDVDKKRLQDAPGFNEKSWPTVATTDFVASIHRYYGVTGQPRDGEAVTIPFKLERGDTFRFRVKERQAMPLTPVADPSAVKDPATPRVDRDPARPDFQAERGALVVDYRLSVDEAPADGPFTLSVIRLPSLPTSGANAGEGRPARENERAARARESSSRIATLKVTKEGRIEKIDGAENESTLRHHLHHVFGTGIHGRSFKPGDIHSHDGSVSREGRASVVIPARPATTPPQTDAWRDFENAQLRFDGLRSGGGMNVASFVLLAPRPATDAREPEERTILGRATYSLSDGLLEELRLRTSSATESDESWVTGDLFTIRRLTGRDEEGSERIISPGN